MLDSRWGMRRELWLNLGARAQLHADHQVARLRLADSQAKQQDATKHCHSRKRAVLGIDGFKRDKNDPSVIVF